MNYMIADGGMATWSAETWIFVVVSAFSGVMGVWAKYESSRNKQRITETDKKAETAATTAQAAQSQLNEVSTTATVAAKSAEIANTRVGNVSQVVNATRSDVTRLAAQMPSQTWWTPQAEQPSSDEQGQQKTP